MGDRWYLSLKCAYCGEINPKPNKETEFWEEDFIYYAPTCGVTTFQCDFCGKKNRITEIHKAIKIK